MSYKGKRPAGKTSVVAQIMINTMYIYLIFTFKMAITYDVSKYIYNYIPQNYTNNLVKISPQF